MSLTFTFALNQQGFELQFNNRTRRLPLDELTQLLDRCESTYYDLQYDLQSDRPADLEELGRSLYRWLDGDEGWLRGSLDTPQTLTFRLIYSAEIQNLDPQTQSMALKLAHLPWELLHDGQGFLMKKGELTMPPVRLVQGRSGEAVMQNRPLHLLFMATSPNNIEPVLAYERKRPIFWRRRRINRCCWRRRRAVRCRSCGIWCGISPRISLMCFI
ncbi:MAG: hypothetical protein MUF49_16650 [Oculatellaceae cyanobacterium Prado106]|jgi:hypothetical protein|nr:hypothetical protein [Oculatellaceae cyanobacterium Prado106]